MHEAPGVLPDFPNGIEDNTHFRYAGAVEMARIVCGEIEGRLPGLAAYLIERPGSGL